MYKSTLSLTSAVYGGGGKRHAPAALPPGKSRYPLYRRLGGPQDWLGQVRKISPPPGFDPHSESPYQLRYPGSKCTRIYIICKIQGYQRSVVENLRLLILCHVHRYMVTNISKDHSDFKMVVP